MIEAFPPKETRARMADWVELDLVFSGAPSTSDARVEGANALVEDEPEHGSGHHDGDAFEDSYDQEILEPAVEARREALWNEFEYRTRALGGAYPFKVSATPHGGWRLTWRSEEPDKYQVARDVYVAALVMSGFRNHLVPRPAEKTPAHATYKALVKRISELFQAVSVLAASRLSRDVYWFGWPRQDASGFLSALADVRGLMGLGVLKNPPSVTAVNMKDGTIDLIGWRAFGDRMYGAILLYGQVASGSNWLSKPLRGHISGKFLHHFVDSPGEHFLVSMFIPFVTHDDVASVKDISMERMIEETSCSRERDYGVIIDRLRIAELLAETAEPIGRLHNAPDPDKVLADVATWVGDCRVFIDQAG